MIIKIYSIGGFGGYLRRSELQPSIKTRMQDRIYPTKWEPTTVAIPWPDSTKMRYPRVCQKRGPLINPFSKEGLELAKEKEKKEAEDNRQFGEAMELLWAKFEIEKKEMVIISFD